MARIPKKETIKNALKYYAWYTKAVKRTDGKFRRKLEQRTKARLKRAWKKQIRWLVDNIKDLPQFANDETVKILKLKNVNPDIQKLVDDMPFNDEVVASFTANAKASYKKGGRKAFKQFDLARVGLSFSLVNEGAVEYINALTTLHLSSYRGSITRTTKKRIIKILQNSVATGLNYTDTAKLIRKQAQAGVFSQARAEMIAVREMGVAYEKGNFLPIKRYQDEYGAIIQKSWITAQDDVVTWQCAENEATGWLATDEIFPHTGLQTEAPRSDHPRCRCATGYREVDLNGQPV